MDKIIVDRYVSPCGVLLLGDWHGRLCLCDWAEAKHRATVDRRLMRQLGTAMTTGSTPLTERAKIQLDEYFQGLRTVFDLPTLECGSDFQCSVWRQIETISYGTTMTYGDLARSLLRPTASRAVANAVGANALALVCPCHRVIGVGKANGGYSGGQVAKRYLLTMEKGLNTD